MTESHESSEDVRWFVL